VEFWFWWLAFVSLGLLISLFVKLNSKDLSLNEFLLTIAFSMLGGTIVVLSGKYVALSDTEILNGYVVSKEIKSVHCSHSYSCNCRTNTVGKVTTTTCDTCYEHNNDFDYIVHSNIGDLKIKREDRQGLKMPKRYSEVVVGEPFSREKYFTNYIKAAPNSLFNEIKYTKKDVFVPEYPKVYDYYKINRVVLDRNVNFNASFLNENLNKHLKGLGGKKELNIVLVITEKAIEDSVYIKTKWLGGKQNDLIVILGIKNNEFNYSDVFSFSKNELINYKLKRELNELFLENKSFDLSNQENILHSIVNNAENFFERKSMEEFKYLEEEIEPPLWMIFLGLIISVLGTKSLLFYFHKKRG
jgi:hypothetical protein